MNQQKVRIFTKKSLFMRITEHFFSFFLLHFCETSTKNGGDFLHIALLVLLAYINSIFYNVSSKTFCTQQNPLDLTSDRVSHHMGGD